MSTLPEQADVVVIGGGPAGSTAANLLARQGYDVVLVDQARHPRPVVGESVLPHFWKYADQLGATEDLERAAFIRKSGATGVWGGKIRQLFLSDFGFTRAALHVERDEFDDILLRVAQRRGARVFEQVAARSVELDPARRSVTCVDRLTDEERTVRCRYVIDASGQAAVLARQLGLRQFDPDLRFMSVWGYFAGSDYVARGGDILPFGRRREVPPTTLQLGMGDWGWAWHIVQKEYTSVGLVLAPSQSAGFKAGAERLDQRFEAACRRLPVLSNLLRDAVLVPQSVRAIRDFAYHPTELSGDGWYLAGDSSAFVDPINSAGVLTAFYAGAASAAAVHASFGAPARSAYFAEIYAALLRRRLALFRIAALPVGFNSYPEDLPLALAAARLDSASEQELLAVQTVVMNRRENLMPLLELDGRLNYGASDRYLTLERLGSLDAGLLGSPAPERTNPPSVVSP